MLPGRRIVLIYIYFFALMCTPVMFLAGNLLKIDQSNIKTTVKAEHNRLTDNVCNYIPQQSNRKLNVAEIFSCCHIMLHRQSYCIS